MKNRNEVIEGMEELFEIISENSPDDKKRELERIKQKLKTVKENEKKLIVQEAENIKC